MIVNRRLHVVQDEDDQTPVDLGLKVAFATSDMKEVNQHFGSAKSFAIYSVSPESVEFIEAAQFGTLDQDGDEDKLSVKFELLKGCVAVYCQAAGASAIRQLVGLGIQPVKVAENSPIEDLIEDLQHELNSGPSAWLAKAIREQVGGYGANRFEEMTDEDWSE